MPRSPVPPRAREALDDESDESVSAGQVTPPGPQDLLEEGVVREAADELVEEGQHRFVAQPGRQLRPDRPEQPGLEDRPEAPEEGAPDLRVARGLREDDPNDVARRRPRRLLEDQPRQPRQRLPDVRRRPEALEDRGLLRPVGLQDRQQHGPLVLEIVVEDRLGQAARGRDAVHADAVVAVPREQAARVTQDLGDLPPAIVGVRGAHRG
jgi:hypothetical protein